MKTGTERKLSEIYIYHSKLLDHRHLCVLTMIIQPLHSVEDFHHTAYIIYGCIGQLMSQSLRIARFNLDVEKLPLLLGAYSCCKWAP